MKLIQHQDQTVPCYMEAASESNRHSHSEASILRNTCLLRAIRARCYIRNEGCVRTCEYIVTLMMMMMTGKTKAE